MSNHITIELSAEDRAKLDHIASLLNAQITLTQFIIDKGVPTFNQGEPDDLTKKLQAIVNGSKTPTEEPKEPTPTTTPIKEEAPTEAEKIEPTPVKTVSRTELGAKVRELMTKGFREQVKAVIQSYAPTVPGVPEDKLNECYDKLSALEG